MKMHKQIFMGFLLIDGSAFWGNEEYQSAPQFPRGKRIFNKISHIGVNAS